MAEINVPNAAGGNKAGVRRSIKLSTRVDLTPMVDLGFFADHLFYFHYFYVEPQSNEAEYAR